MSFLIDPFRVLPPNAEIVYCGYRGSIPFAATVTISDVAIGDEANDRVVFLGILKSAVPEYRTLVSATIGGVAATIQATTESGVNGFDVYWLSAAIPTGTTATVSLVFSGGISGAGLVYVSSFAAYKLQSSDKVDVHSEKQDGSAAAVTQTFNVAAERGGIVLFIAKLQTAYENSLGFTLSGVDKDFEDLVFAGDAGHPQDQIFIGGCAQTDADNPAYAVTVTSPNPAYSHIDYPIVISFR